MLKVFHRFTQWTFHTMAQHKKGSIESCTVCKQPFYRPLHNIRHNTKKWCSKACSFAARTGEGNSFYGKKHGPEVRARISAAVRANPPKGTGPKKGIFRHTPEAKHKMSEALRRRWQQKRADMLSYAKSGLNTPFDAFKTEPRWRLNFTRTQKRDWIGTECAFCFAKEDLVLDHIIPVICGGINEKSNSQTLCQNCNRWKMKYVDRPLYAALLGSERG